MHELQIQTQPEIQLQSRLQPVIQLWIQIQNTVRDIFTFTATVSYTATDTFVSSTAAHTQIKFL